jgi:hypothetical protein
LKLIVDWLAVYSTLAKSKLTQSKQKHMTRKDYRQNEIMDRKLTSIIARSNMALPYHSKVRFLQAIKAQPLFSARLSALQQATDYMDRLCSSRRDGSINSDRTGTTYGLSFESIGHAIGSAELPMAYAPQAQRESVASVETLDNGTNYNLSPL